MDEALAQLVEMGYTIDHSTHALKINDHNFDKTLNWLFKNPSVAPKAKQKHKHNHKNGKGNGKHRRVISLLNMGFNEDQSKEALEMNGDNVEKAIDYLLEHYDCNDDLDDFILINDEEEKAKDAEWDMISANDIKAHHISPHDMDLLNPYECTLISPYKLKHIITHCPTRLHLYQWKIFYSTHNDGISAQTLYEKMENIEESIVIINDANDSIFGAFIDCKWKQPKTKKIEYKGTIDCFVFNFVQNQTIKDKDKLELKIYKGSGYKQYFFRNDDESVTIGAGESPAIYFDYDFSLGRSVRCKTFNSPSLSKETQFKIKKLEIWAPIIKASV